MNYCQNCGGKTRPLDGGHGCGGVGSLDGCPKCGAVYRQTTGGIVPTHGGEQYERVEYTTYKEEFYRLAKEIAVYLVDGELAKKYNPEHYGEWAWSEAGFGTSHYYKTETAAKGALTRYVQKLYDELPWPDCDKCGKKAERGFGNQYECKPCGRFCFVIHGKKGEFYDRKAK